MKLVRYFYLLLICLSLAYGGCIGSETARQSRYNKKQEKIMMKQMKKEYEYALKHHYEMQSKRTQDMMHNSTKKTKRTNKKRKKGLFRTAGSCKSNKPIGPLNEGN